MVMFSVSNLDHLTLPPPVAGPSLSRNICAMRGASPWLAQADACSTSLALLDESPALDSPKPVQLRSEILSPTWPTRNTPFALGGRSISASCASCPTSTQPSVPQETRHHLDSQYHLMQSIFEVELTHNAALITCPSQMVTV